MGRKVKMGRPPVKVKRSVMVHFRMTPAEARALKAAARAAGLNLTDYLLRLCKEGG